MNKKILITIVVFCSAFAVSFNLNDGPEKNSYSTSIVDSKKLDVNNISTWFRNNGSFNRDPATANSGFEWPRGSFKFARYASGLWLGAKVGNDTLIAIAEYDYEYLPGYVDNNGNPQGSNDPLYRIYRIDRGDTLSSDYLNWPINQGAYTNFMGKPFFLGTQTMFYSYTDAYPEAHGNNAGSTAPLKVQIQQTNWSYTNVGLRDVCFTEFRIINRNNQPWVNAYMTVWTDDDLGGATDDAIGVDTIRYLQYTFNFTNYDNVYGINPPAVGYKYLRGPITPSIGDTARYFNPPGSNNLIIKPNHKISNASSFNSFYSGHPQFGDPSHYRETYFNLQGLCRDRSNWRDPITNLPSKFPYSGDPVSGTGWLEVNSGDRRTMFSVGPVNIPPNDTQSIIVAQVIARGSSNLNSITKLRELSDHVQSVYDNNFQEVLAVNNLSNEIPDGFKLNQNYPNPFNPNTVISYQLAVSSFIVLKVYDPLGKEVATLVNEKQNAGSCNYQFSTINFQLPSGIYFYKLSVGDFSDTKRMILLK